LTDADEHRVEGVDDYLVEHAFPERAIEAGELFRVAVHDLAAHVTRESEPVPGMTGEQVDPVHLEEVDQDARVEAGWANTLRGHVVS
jgi:hypothetical protein